MATEWVARITAVSLLMFLPGVGGQWLDDRLNTKIFTLAGFAFGFCAGLATLLVMVNKKNPPGPAHGNAADNPQGDSEHLEDSGGGEDKSR